MNQELTPDQIKAIRLTVLAKERVEVKTRTGERGGADFYVPSYLDVLLDADVITPSQRSIGLVYQSLKQAAFSDLDAKTSKVFDAYQPENALEAHTTREGHCPSSTYHYLSKSLAAPVRIVLNACCGDGYGPGMAIIWGFGEHRIRNAFEDLEHWLPIAEKECE